MISKIHSPQNLQLASVCSNNKYTTVVRNVTFRTVTHQIYIVSFCTLRRTNTGTERKSEIISERLGKLYWWKIPVFSGMIRYNVAGSQQIFEGNCYVHSQN